MKILAVDSSGMVASVAVLENDELIAEYTSNYKKTHSQTLLPMLDEVKKMVELDLNSIDAIAVAAGPGSFTGLRIGSATVKGLGFALNKPVIPVPTVDALAFNMFGSSAIICPLMDARRNQVYTGLYTFENGKMITLQEQCAVDIKDIIDKANSYEKEIIFLGDGVSVYKDVILENIRVPYYFAPASCNRQRAACVGALGRLLYENGVVEAAKDHAPDYLRLSQAERERAEKEQN